MKKKYKPIVNGITLVLSCQKYVDTRLKKYSVPQVDGWPVIKVIGDLRLDVEWRFVGELLVIRCEDSYLHLMKKLVMAMSIIMSIFEIREGILRCGDDLIFNGELLRVFLASKNKPAYIGQSASGLDFIVPRFGRQIKFKTRFDKFMLDYYENHLDDFKNPLHNLPPIETLGRYCVRPDLYGASGAIYYLSRGACEVLIRHMAAIGNNILTYDSVTGSYPYVIEDCGVSYVMYRNGISFVSNDGFIGENGIVMLGVMMEIKRKLME